MPDTSVKYFDSTMSGAPVLSGTAGALVNVLDACLVNGFGTATLNSLVIANNVATGTVSAGHGLSMICGTNNASPGVGPVIRIDGATPSALNGDWRLASVPNSTTLTFAVPGIADQTATGTITVKRAPAGWVKSQSGSQKAAYARSSLGATAMLLRVDDTPAQYPTLIMYESMTSVDAGAGAAPTSGSLYSAKSTVASATARQWRVVVDGHAVYFFAQPDGINWSSAVFFGDICNYKSGDQYHCALIANLNANTASYLSQLAGNTSGALLARAASQVGAAIALGRHSHSCSGSMIGSAGNPYPGIDGAVHCCPIEAWEIGAINAARGLMPGMYNALHNAQPPDGTLVNSIPQLIEHQILAISVSNNSFRGLIDISGPWR